jgi:hypothetical protein
LVLLIIAISLAITLVLLIIAISLADFWSGKLQSGIRFRNSMMKYHENIVNNQESVMTLESDTHPKSFMLKNIRSICTQVCKNIKLTEQIVSEKYEEQLSIHK